LIHVKGSRPAARAAQPPFATGHVEGDFVLIAPVAAARVAEVPVRRRQTVHASETLATLERRDAIIALAEAEAALARARNRLADLRQGRRD
jgi:HlyD family secretion protein